MENSLVVEILRDNGHDRAVTVLTEYIKEERISLKQVLSTLYDMNINRNALKTWYDETKHLTLEV